MIAGLLDRNSQAVKFINTVKEEPLDLLGPTHQQLVIHYLSEISGNLPAQEALTQRLARWLLFECRFHNRATLVSKVKFPEEALQTALLNESSNV